MTRPRHLREHPGLRVELFLRGLERDLSAIPAGGALHDRLPRLHR
jgi:hypothetical protein